MKYVADLHLHSKYSRAVSQDMVLVVMNDWAKKKGLDILTTGDWTHPLWFREIRNQLEEAGEGIYKIKDQKSKIKNEPKETLFILTTEISSIYSQGGKTRRIHNLVFAPDFETAEKINQELFNRGCNLTSDGRPIIGLSSRYLLELLLSIDERIILIPCHAWTPWFSLYGSMSGFDSIEECFGEYSKYIYAVETGLSSDPEMNWRIKELDGRSIVSFSDSHSPAKMGRECTIFEAQNSNVKSQNYNSNLKIDYKDIISAIKKDIKGDLKIGYTIEFYPEEGKYHYTGHRNCKVVQSPQDTKTKGVFCPVCRRPLTVGVMHRVEQLTNKNSKFKIQNSELDRYGVRWIEDLTENHPPYVKLVPLLEIIAESLDLGVSSIKVKSVFDDLCFKFGSEIDVLLKTNIQEIEKFAGSKIAEGVKKVRGGDIAISPGFDGEYGKVKIWASDQKIKKDTPQLALDF